MKSITFSKEVEIDVDIYDVWEEMSENDKDYFCREEGLSRKSSKHSDDWQDFVYQLSDDDVQDIMRWMKFYGKTKDVPNA